MGSVDDVVLKKAADVGEEGGDDDGGAIEVLGEMVSSRVAPRKLLGAMGAVGASGVCSALVTSLDVITGLGTDGRTGVDEDDNAKEEILGGGTGGLRGGAVGIVVGRAPMDLNLPSFSRGGTWKEIVSGRRKVATSSLPVVRTELSVTMAGFVCVICSDVWNGR